VSQVSLTENGYLSDDGQTYIMCTQYLFDRMAVCAITSAGDIILWDVTKNEVYFGFGFLLTDLHNFLYHIFAVDYCSENAVSHHVFISFSVKMNCVVDNHSKQCVSTVYLGRTIQYNPNVICTTDL